MKNSVIFSLIFFFTASLNAQFLDTSYFANNSKIQYTFLVCSAKVDNAKMLNFFSDESHYQLELNTNIFLANNYFKTIIGFKWLDRIKNDREEWFLPEETTNGSLLYSPIQDNSLFLSFLKMTGLDGQLPLLLQIDFEIGAMQFLEEELDTQQVVLNVTLDII